VADTVSDVVPHHHLGEALHALAVDDLAEAHPGRLRLGVHLPVLALDNRRADC